MRKRKKQPVHPGKIIKETYLKPLAITITDLASILGVSRKTLSKIINERGAITPDMSLRLSRAFDTSPELWLTMQNNYDLWQAEHASRAWRMVKPISPQPLNPHTGNIL